MNITVSGLGRMGGQIARRLIDDGHTVTAHDINPKLIKALEDYGAAGAPAKKDVIRHGGERLVLWLMIPSNSVANELAEWTEILPAGSIVVDGGNSDFRDTIRHAHLAASKGIQLIDVGTSGGIHGLKNGFSMMVGGDQAAYEYIEPVLASLSKPHGGYRYFGPAGAGHYVKMVHNAIEYGVMESLAEGYRLLREGPYEKLDLIDAGEVWQEGSIIASNLNALTVTALKNNPSLDDVSGYVAESGEARWALEVAKERSIEVPAIQAAFDVRIASQTGRTNFATKLLAMMRNAFGGHTINKDA